MIFAITNIPFMENFKNCLHGIFSITPGFNLHPLYWRTNIQVEKGSHSYSFFHRSRFPGPDVIASDGEVIHGNGRLALHGELDVLHVHIHGHVHTSGRGFRLPSTCFFCLGEFGEFGSMVDVVSPLCLRVSLIFCGFCLGWIRVKTTHNASIGSYRTIIEFLAPIAIDSSDHGYVVVRSYHNKP